MKPQLKALAGPARTVVGLALLTATLWMSLTESAWAVPSYSRRYGVECSTCHTMWGALNGAGVTFRLSGYRAIAGRELKPVSEDMEISKDLTIPTTLPLSFVTGVGIDARTEKRSSDTGTSTTSRGSSLALEDASIFLTSPIGDRLAAFVEFPMFESRAWEFTPTGKGEANAAAGRNIQFSTESPAFEVAKFLWSNPLGDTAPKESFNILAGITHLPLGYASGKVRLSVNQYLVYERTALDLISPHRISDLLGGADSNDLLFRLSEPQVLAEAQGILTFGKPLAEVAKRETLWAEYHLGISNGSNARADNNTKKDLYGRGVARWYSQNVGLFFYRSADIYGDELRDVASQASATGFGIMSGAQDPNKVTRIGPDFQLSMVPFGVPLWLDNQILYNKETNPTGFGKEFKWKGGFHQLNWQMSKVSIAYARYDWIKGDSFSDVGVVVNGETGITEAKPKEWDIVAGFQHLVTQNAKFVAELRHHNFEDTSMPTTARLKDNGFTLRMMFGF